MLTLVVASGAGVPPKADGKHDNRCKEHHPNERPRGVGHDQEEWRKKCGTASATIGLGGGTLSTATGLTIEIPFGALDQPTTLSVTVSSVAPPSDLAAVSPVYQFSPEGIVFAKPLTVSLPLPAGITSASIYWSKLGAPGFEPIGGTITNGFITAQTPHFGLAVIGVASPVRTVNGVGKLTWISATSRTSVPRDFSTIPTEAILQDSAGNVRQILAVAGTGAALGTFTIAGVPNGDYILHSGNQYLVTSTNAPDLGSARGGRPDQIALLGPANIDFSLTNLAPWQDGDTLELFSTEVDDWDFQTERFVSLAPGQTTLAFTLDVNTLDGTAAASLIQGSAGDHLYFAQLSKALSPNGTPYQALSRLVQFPLFDLIEGGSVPLSGALVDVQKGNSIDLDYRGAAFKSLIEAEGNPSQSFTCGDSCGGSLGVLAQAGTSADGFYTANADLLILSDPLGTNMQTGAMTYGSPVGVGLVGNWGLVGLARWAGRVFHRLPGAMPVFRGAFSGIDWTTDAAAFAAPAVLTPPLSLPRNIVVSGQNFFADCTLGILTPTVSWTAPALGLPTRYELNIRKLGLTPDGLRTKYSRNVARLITADTSFKVPPGVLVSGYSYVFSLSAIQAPSAGAAPFRAVLESVSMTTPSGVLTAP